MAVDLPTQANVTLTAGAVPDVVSLLEQINTSFGTWYAATALANAIRTTRSTLLSVGKASSRPLEFHLKGILTIRSYVIT